jgi:hypothetical protein
VRRQLERVEDVDLDDPPEVVEAEARVADVPAAKSSVENPSSARPPLPFPPKRPTSRPSSRLQRISWQILGRNPILPFRPPQPLSARRSWSVVTTRGSRGIPTAV